MSLNSVLLLCCLRAASQVEVAAGQAAALERGSASLPQVRRMCDLISPSTARNMGFAHLPHIGHHHAHLAAAEANNRYELANVLRAALGFGYAHAACLLLEEPGMRDVVSSALCAEHLMQAAKQQAVKLQLSRAAAEAIHSILAALPVQPSQHGTNNPDRIRQTVEAEKASTALQLLLEQPRAGRPLLARVRTALLMLGRWVEFDTLAPLGAAGMGAVGGGAGQQQQEASPQELQVLQPIWSSCLRSSFLTFLASVSASRQHDKLQSLLQPLMEREDPGLGPTAQHPLAHLLQLPEVVAAVAGKQDLRVQLHRAMCRAAPALQLTRDVAQAVHRCIAARPTVAQPWWSDVRSPVLLLDRAAAALAVVLRAPAEGAPSNPSPEHPSPEHPNPQPCESFKQAATALLVLGRWGEHEQLQAERGASAGAGAGSSTSSGPDTAAAVQRWGGVVGRAVMEDVAAAGSASATLHKALSDAGHGRLWSMNRPETGDSPFVPLVTAVLQPMVPKLLQAVVDGGVDWEECAPWLLRLLVLADRPDLVRRALQKLSAPVASTSKSTGRSSRSSQSRAAEPEYRTDYEAGAALRSGKLACFEALLPCIDASRCEHLLYSSGVGQRAPGRCSQA
jgi:hypothetical protein